MSKEFASAMRMCARWGVNVLLGADANETVARVTRSWVRDARWSGAPQSAANTYWPTLIAWEDKIEKEDSAPLLHELAHCLDSELPRQCDEVHGPLLAVEYALDRAVGVARSEWMRDYGVGPYFASWHLCSTRERGRLLANSRKRAVRAGLLTPDGRLTYNKPKHLRDALAEMKKGT
jgi:hypothetical protein